MARVRLIHVGLGQNEQLSKQGPVTMLVAALLPTIADREGRLKDIPISIHGQILPFLTDISMEDTLNKLEECGYIVRYTVGDKRYIQITNFGLYQRPHVKELKSVIPGQCSALPKAVLSTDLRMVPSPPESYNPIIQNPEAESGLPETPTDELPFHGFVEGCVDKPILAIDYLNIYIRDHADDIWKRYCAPGQGLPMYNQMGLAKQFTKMRAWVSCDSTRAYAAWFRWSTNGSHNSGMINWINNWLTREYDKPPVLKTPISSSDEQKHYDGHKRSAGVDRDFTPVGEVDSYDQRNNE